MQVAHAPQRGGSVLDNQFFTIGNRLFQQLAFLGQLVDQTQIMRLLGTHRLAGGDDVQRGLYAHQTRQALGGTGTRQHAQKNLRQAHLG